MRPVLRLCLLAPLFAVALASGCGGVSAPGSDGGGGDGDVGDAGEGVGDGGGNTTSEISGTMIDLHVTADGEEMAPVDLSAAVIEVWIEDDGGTHPRLAGSGEADGSFSVDDVPQGIYQLRIDDSYFATDARSLDLGANLVGRPDAATVSSPTPLRLEVDGLEPWQLADRLDLFAPNASASYYGVDFSAEPPMAENDTSIAFTANYQFASEPYLIDGDAGDIAYLLHMGSQDGSEPYSALTQVFQPEPFTMVDGEEVVLTGGFSEVVRDQSLAVDFRGTSFEDAVNQMIIGEVLIPASPSFTLYVSPYSIERGDLSFIALAEYLAPDLGDHAVTMEYGNPFPAGWVPYEYYTVVTGSYVDAEQTAMGLGFMAGGDVGGGLSDGPIELRLGPVQEPTMDGVALEEPTTTGNSSPTLSWGAPVVGTADYYIVNVRRVTPEGSTRGVFLASLTTITTSLTIPGGLLRAHETYFFEIDAVSRPGADPARAPFRRQGPTSSFARRPTAAVDVYDLK